MIHIDNNFKKYFNKFKNYFIKIKLHYRNRYVIILLPIFSTFDCN